MKISEFSIESKVQRKQNIKYCYKNWTRLNITGIFAKAKTKGIFFQKNSNFQISVHIMSAKEVSLRAEEDKLKGDFKT